MLSARPVHSLPERAGVEKLKHVARITPDQVTALVLAAMTAHRESGAPATAGLWTQAPANVCRIGLQQLLITVCHTTGSEHGRLPPSRPSP